MKNKLLSIILLSCLIINFLNCGNVGYCATVSSTFGDWYVQNHTPTEGSYLTDEGDGNIKVTTSGQNMLELIRYPQNSSGCDIVTVRFGAMFEDTSINRIMAVRGKGMSTHSYSSEFTVLKFNAGGKCRVGAAGDTFVYEIGKWYDFSVNIFLRTGHIVAEVETDGVTSTYTGNLSASLYDLWRVYFIAFSYGALRETNYHIRNFEIIETPHVSSYPEDGAKISSSTGKLKITFPTDISLVSSIRLNGVEVKKKDIAISGKNVYVWCSLQKNTDYNLKYHGVTNSYGDIYTGEIDFSACDVAYLSNIEYFSDGEPTDITIGENMSAKFNVVSKLEKKVRVYAALYSVQTGKLEGIEQLDCTLVSGNNELEISIDKPQIEDDVNMKLFVWNDNLSPVAKEETLPFVRPKGEKVLQDLAKKTATGSHPRLYIDKDGLENLKTRINTIPDFADGFDAIKTGADSLLDEAPLIYEKRDGLRLYPAHNMRPRIQSLGMTYAITGDEKYAERLWQELEAACEFPDWNPYHFLDTGVLLVTIAEGYDWAYDYISKDEAKVAKLVNAVETKGFEPLLDDYLDRPRQRTYKWAQQEKADNWNVVCNAGGIMASLAFADESPEYAKQILGYALPLLEKSVIYFAPDGAWFEGISYWSYMLGYFADILSSLNTSLGTDYGFSKVEGLDKTGYFPFNISGPMGIFNFSNASEANRAFRGDNSCFLLANVFGDKNLESLQFNAMKNGGLTFDYKALLWYKGDFEIKETSLPLDSYYRDTEVCAMKGDGLFVGFRAGSDSVAHSHLDTGSFVLDMEGERFASDLGSEDYNISTTYKREKYRERAEGHNTLVINPDINPDQIESSFARIDRFVSSETEAYALCDMTSAYADDVISAAREIFLENNRRTVRIHDEINCIDESEIWWFMHTRAEVTLSEDGKTAYLTRNGKTIKAVINSEGTFSVMDAIPLETSPQNDNQNKNVDYRKLAVHYNGVKDLQIDISFSPESF